MLILYDGTTSVCAIKVRLTLFEMGIDFQSYNVNLRDGEQFSPDYLRLNPNAVVPTLIDGDTVVLESTIIMQYIEELNEKISLVPQTPQTRATMRMWLKKIDEIIHPATGILTHATAFRPSFLQKSKQEQKVHLDKIPDIGRRNRQEAVYREGLSSPIVENAVWTYDKFIRELEDVLNMQDFIAGRLYSLADAAATPYINRLSALKLLTVWREKAPAICDWSKRIQSRSSFPLAVTNYLDQDDIKQFSQVDDNISDVARRILSQKRAY